MMLVNIRSRGIMFEQFRQEPSADSTLNSNTFPVIFAPLENAIRFLFANKKWPAQNIELAVLCIYQELLAMIELRPLRNLKFQQYNILDIR